MVSDLILWVGDVMGRLCDVKWLVGGVIGK